MENYGNQAAVGYGGEMSGIADGRLSAKQASPMEVALKTLAERLGRLEQCVTVIEQRFCAVVRPEPPTPVATERAKSIGTRSSSSIGVTIENTVAQIEAMSERLHSLAQRCEL